MLTHAAISLARDFIRKLIVVDPNQRLTAKQALQHPWILEDRRTKTSPKKKFQKAVGAVRAIRKFQSATKELRERYQPKEDVPVDGNLMVVDRKSFS